MTERAKDKLTALLEPVVEETGYELVDLEYQKESGHWVLRLFIDRPEGITLDDCEAVSERVGRYLDEVDPIPHRYFLEVSSPGVNRTLRKDRDFERFRGQKVWVRTYGPVEGRRQFRGQLQGLEAGCVLVREGDMVWRIPREAVAKARLEAE
ncbi:MAG: ribosome maturation factor RimP [Clostridia bacterium]|nr:ribosome maturation factor RimP [Clostridia bacterium]MDH7572383.1 ribosome maturation factor RimP [Clostridia bacterium]